MIADRKLLFEYVAPADCPGCAGDMPRSQTDLIEDPDHPGDLLMVMVVCASCEKEIYERWRAERLDPLRQGRHRWGAKSSDGRGAATSPRKAPQAREDRRARSLGTVRWRPPERRLAIARRRPSAEAEPAQAHRDARGDR
jgi:hypothetical protein